MVYGFRGYCLDCSHQWDWLRLRLACGQIDFRKPETYRWYYCHRCIVDLFVPRCLNRSSWLRWVSENASELSRLPLVFRACELGVRVDREALDVIVRSPPLFKACESVASILAGTRSPYVPVSIDVWHMECPQCGDQMAIGEFDTDPPNCPDCASPNTRSIGAPAAETGLVGYWPLDDKEIRQVIVHLKKLAQYAEDSHIEGKPALATSAGLPFLWDRELDGLV
jgi:hypothetical protein